VKQQQHCFSFVFSCRCYPDFFDVLQYVLPKWFF
jgi:hypothetical protein